MSPCPFVFTSIVHFPVAVGLFFLRMDAFFRRRKEGQSNKECQGTFVFVFSIRSFLCLYHFIDLYYPN
ncbi:hypothetical protein F5H01DRAFT_357212, partial [Linnemannia elongata]